MVTVRRLYIYIVCLISLQAAMVALNGLLGALIGWLAGAGAPDALSLTFLLAVLIVSTPIFAGHWLWALALARREPLELNSLTRRLYLYATQAVFMAYLAVAVFMGTQAFFALILPATSDGSQTNPQLIETILHSGVTVALAGALWFYHHRLIASNKLTPDGSSRVIQQLYLLAYSAIGLLVAATGLAGFQIWIFHRLSGDSSSTLPPTLAAMLAGALLWVYHERARGRAAGAPDAGPNGLRWLYAIAAAGIAVLVAFGGLYGVQVWLFHKLAGELLPALPDALAALTTGLLVFVYYERAAHHALTPGTRPLRWLYDLLFSAIGMLSAVGGLVAALQWTFASLAGTHPEVADGAAWLLPGLALWLYSQRDLTQTGAALGLADDSTDGFRGGGRLLRRLYVLAFSASGVGLAALGLIAVQEWLFARLGGTGVFQLPDALAWLITGLLLWLYFWRWAGRLFASVLADERRSDLRKAYLYLIISVSVITAITTIALLVNGALRAWLGLATQGSLGLSLAIIIAAVALWAYHATVLRGDIAAAGESALQAGMQRLYWYVVAALGLAAFVVGISGELSVAVRWLALGFRADDTLKEQFAAFTAAFVAGLPVWLLAWTPAQRTAGQAGAAGLASRRSILRKAYLYFYLLAAVVVTLSSAVRVVYQLLNALFGLFGGGNVLADIAQSIGFTVISSAVWLYHGWVLRGDGRRAKLDKGLEADEQARADEQTASQLAADWARFPVAVADGGDGSFGLLALAALKRQLPHVTLIPIGLTAEAGAAMGADPVAGADQLLAAWLLVVASTALAAGPVAASPAQKIVAPISAPGVQWAGVAADVDLGLEVARAVRQAIQTQAARQAPAPVVSGANGS